MNYKDEMSCQQLVELVTDYFEDALPPKQRELLEKHLEVCPGCRNYIEQMRETIKLTGTVNEDEVPDHVRNQLLDVFQQWKGSPHQE